MSEVLGREQMEDMLIDAEIQDGHIHKRLLDHDAFQRRRIAELEAEVARLKAEVEYYHELGNEARSV